MKILQKTILFFKTTQNKLMNKIMYALFATALFFTAMAFAPIGTSLSGIVTEQEMGETVIAANITLHKKGKFIAGTTTDFNGSYQFDNINPGTYDVKVLYIGYSDRVIKDVIVLAGKSNKLNIQINQGDIQLSEVIVTAYKAPLIKQDNTTQGKIITSEEIKNLPTRNISSLAATVPGISISKPSRAERRKRKKMQKENAKHTQNLSAVTITAPRIMHVKKSVGYAVQDEGDRVMIRGSRANATAYYVDGIRVGGEGGSLKNNKTIIRDSINDFSNERYDEINENPFLLSTKTPLSTFSIDVDAAAYSNMRRFIKNGSLPPKDAIRIEEMVNYFNYDYPEPTGKHPFEIITEISDSPWQEGNKLLHVGLQGKHIATNKLPASNLVFLIDVSGSMSSSDKLPLLKSSLNLLVDNLRQQDMVTIVVYAGAAGMVLKPTSGADTHKIKGALNKLNSGGSTAGGAGIQLAYKMARQNFIEDGNNRVILATDGDFNVGISNDNDLVKMIEKERESGVFLSVLGFGTGNYQDAKMQKLANKGNGNHSYIDNLAEAKKVLVNEFGGTMFTIAKDVKLQLEFNPTKVQAYRLIGYENRLLADEDFADDTKDAGEMGAGHTVTAIYEIIPVGQNSPFLTDTETLKYQETSVKKSAMASNEWVNIKFRYKAPDGKKSKLIERTALDNGENWNKSSENYRWAAVVAEFGLLLRDSQYKGTANWKDLITRAEAAKGADINGYRAEMIELIKLAEGIVDVEMAKK